MFQMKVPATLVPTEGSLTNYWMVTFLLGPPSADSDVSSGVSSSSYKDTNPPVGRPDDLLNLLLSKGHPSQYYHIGI